MKKLICLKKKNSFFELYLLFLFISSFQTSAQNWEKTFGGTLSEDGSAVQQTSDNGFIVAGTTTTFGAGGEDIYLIKTNINGDTSWTKTFGGNFSDRGHDVQQTFDGGYILGCETSGFGAGAWDAYLVKTDAAGNVVWTKTYGSTTSESCNDVIQTADSGYCFTGLVTDSTNTTDMWLVKTNSVGDTLWTRTYGGSGHELSYSLQQTIDGGFILAGASYNLTGNGYEMYLIRTNNTGDTLWTRKYGASGHAYATSVALTNDSGFIVGGVSAENFIAIKLNSAGTLQWSKEIINPGQDRCFSIIQSNDNGYVMAGYTFEAPAADVWIVKLDAGGNLKWEKKYGGSEWDEAAMIKNVNGGGFIIAGTTESFGGYKEVYLIKTGCDNFPSVSISTIDTICQGNQISSTLSANAVTGVTYQWSKNDTDIAGATTPSQIFHEDGAYKVRVTDSNSCYNESNIINIYFPEPYFTPYPDVVCPGDEIVMGKFNFGAEIYPAYNWDFGDGTSGTGNIATHIYQDTGVYVITRTVVTSNGNCNAYSDSVRITTTAIPPVDFDLLVNSQNMLYNAACPGDRIDFLPYAYSYLFVRPPAFPATTYSWDFGDGTTDTVPFPNHIYADTGNYTITFTVSNSCGNTNSVSTTILIDTGTTVNSTLDWKDSNGNFSMTVDACEPVVFHAYGGVSYQWDFGDGTTLSTNVDTANHAYALAGNYNIQLTAINSCGNAGITNHGIIVDGVCAAVPFLSDNKMKVTVFPNPFTTTANLQITNLNDFKNVELKIYDLFGREKINQKVSNSEFTFNRDNLPNGIYMYILANKTGDFASGKIIIQ